MSHPTRRDALRLGAALVALPLGATVARAAADATVHTVVIKEFSFNPADLAIKAGDSVTFINEDSVRHTATDTNGAFDTGLLSKGQEGTVTFGSAGQFSYLCRPHPRMRGTITIS
tara:strand:+ start:131 stop:475 length:345 start_codon:yes stop_codon:yes gene_type:complete